MHIYLKGSHVSDYSISPQAETVNHFPFSLSSFLTVAISIHRFAFSP